MGKTAKGQVYLIPVLMRTLKIVELLRSENQPMSLTSICRQINGSKSTTYRILSTLLDRGYVAQTQDNHYRYVARSQKLRFGFAGQSSEVPFSEAVEASLGSAATAMGIDLLVLDNKNNAEMAIANAETFIRERVDIVIEYQIEEDAASIITEKMARAQIPLITVDSSHPYATYFEVNSYRASLEVGSLLAKYAIDCWSGDVDWILGLGPQRAGHLKQSGTTCVFEGIKSKLPKLPVESFVGIDGRGTREKSYKAVLDFMNRHPRDQRILIAAANETSVMGAVKAIRELGRERQVAIVSQDGAGEIVEEMLRPGSPVIATVSHEIAQYGPRLIQLGMALLRGETLPPYHYVEHFVLTADFVCRAADSGAPSRRISGAENDDTQIPNSITRSKVLVVGNGVATVASA